MQKYFQPIIADIRRNSIPYFIEFKTHRWREHCGPNYDNDIDIEQLKNLKNGHKDPIKHLENIILKEDSSLLNNLKKIRENIDNEIKQVFIESENDSFPDIDQAYKGIFAPNKNELNLELKE